MRSGFESHRDLRAASFLSVSVFSSAKRRWRPHRPALPRVPKRVPQAAPRVARACSGVVGRRGLWGCAGGKTACPLQALVGRSPWQPALPTFLPAVGHGSVPALRPRGDSGGGGKAAPGSRCDLSSGWAGASEAHAEPPPPGLPAARLPPRPPSPKLCSPSAENYMSQKAARGPPSGSRNYTSQNGLQCAGASMRYGACCNLVAKAPNPRLHLPGRLAARMSRKAVAHGAVTALPDFWRPRGFSQLWGKAVGRCVLHSVRS